MSACCKTVVIGALLTGAAMRLQVLEDRSRRSVEHPTDRLELPVGEDQLFYRLSRNFRDGTSAEHLDVVIGLLEKQVLEIECLSAIL